MPQICNILSWLTVFSKLFFEHFKIIHIIIKVHGIKYLYGVISRHVKKCRTFYLVTLFCNARCNEIQIKLLNPRSPVFRQISFKIQTVRRVRQHILTRRAPPSDLSVSTTSATTTSASPPVFPSVRSTSVAPLQTPPFPLVLVIVLVVVLLLLLVPLLILIQQNRVMRRALSKRRHRTTTEAVYEEIQHRHNHITQRGSLISEELHSEYEVADDLLSAKEFKKFKTAYYDDVTSGSGLKEEMVKEITPGYYDDVITDGLKPDRETEGVQEEYDDVTSVSEDVRNLLVSSLAVHDGLVRLSGERQCEGEVEVFIHQVWSRVLLDSWSLTESSVVCRQLGCGSVLNFYGSSSSSPEHSHECVTGFQCSGSEAHLGNCSSPQTLNCSSTQQLSITCLEFKDIRLTEGCEGNLEVFYNGSWGNVCYNQMDRDTCPSLPWGQNDCGEDEVAKIICSEQESHESPRSLLTCTISFHQRQCSDLPVSTTPATATSASPSVSPTVRSTSVTPQTPSTVSPPPPVPPVLVIVLVVVLLLLLVPLLILIQQNRVMRRALSKRRHRTTTEAVYEEIQHKPTNRHSLFTQRDDLPENYDDVVIIRQFSNDKAGSLISEELHSGYEDADELLSDSSLALHDGLVRLSGERQCEGEVEVFIHQVWRRVLLHSWSLTESSVVCRQLGCGSVLNFNGSSSSSPEHSHECVTGFQCSGSEAHLGNCSSPQTLNCSSTQQLSITCLGENNNIWADSPVDSDQ
ncbi:scavenger receptor cysteine-rich type 1 M130-like protein [Labeo rohita]|uniref:Scavenger receptor cysteine-rich type 1 M130-like protein n=1 Tax=Labeo rohita TaxID=84645 RepID=A0A498MBK3_LABRO|nr:scavenger receptor cysteine-rich type 1 M130-like protein [Labeo rohita]